MLFSSINVAIPGKTSVVFKEQKFAVVKMGSARTNQMVESHTFTMAVFFRMSPRQMEFFKMRKKINMLASVFT